MTRDASTPKMPYKVVMQRRPVWMEPQVLASYKTRESAERALRNYYVDFCDGMAADVRIEDVREVSA